MEDETQELGPFGHFGHHKKREFLEAFVECGNVTESARRAGVHTHSHYYWLKSDTEYVAAFAIADEMGTKTLEGVAFDRASSGQSDTLLIFLLKARNREKYGDKQTISFDKESNEALLERARKSDKLRTLVTEGTGQARAADRN